MTARANARREAIAARIGFATALTAAIAVAVVVRDASARKTPTLSGAVVSNWESASASIAEVDVVTAAGRYTVTCADGVCRLPDRGGHPADPRAVAAFQSAIGSMTYAERKTSDPAKYPRLDLSDPNGGDPSEGGAGADVAVRNASGQELARFVIGKPRIGGGFYLRRPDAAQAFAVRGERPAVDRAADWLNLEFLPFEREDIAHVQIQPSDGPGYALSRPAPDVRDFALLDAPGWALFTAGAGNPTAGALGQFRFADVRLASELEGEPSARYEITTFTGLVVTLDIHQTDAAAWAAVSARAISPEAEAVAEALGAQVEGWAYRLPQYAAERLARPLADIARRAG